ncbi:MAG: DNA polymerase IV [Clostridia bacterium]
MREILHCDLNGFFASVECLKNPKLKEVPMAVCGDPDIRHGIILAKNELAKKYNIQTAETIYSALKKCRNLVLVKCHHEDYEKYSKLVNNIYLKYTDKVQPFGIDESFLDVTESIKLYGNSEKIANLIREDVKNTLGLTISVGVSFNKSLAKLGSDLKKPDAVSVLNYERYKKIIYPMPVNTLLFVGKATNETLKKLKIYTIGDLAIYDQNKLIKLLGKLGKTIHDYACGIDDEEVKRYDDILLPKSISKGLTFTEDLTDISLLEKHIKLLSDEVAYNLRKYNLKCTTVSISIKDNMFVVINRQKHISNTNLFQDISKVGIELLKENYIVGKKIRAITISANNLINPNDSQQIDIFSINNIEIENNKLEEVTKLVDDIKNKYGNDIVTFGSLSKSNK